MGPAAGTGRSYGGCAELSCRRNGGEPLRVCVWTRNTAGSTRPARGHAAAQDARHIPDTSPGGRWRCDGICQD
jgi:hypothetical protein